MPEVTFIRHATVGGTKYTPGTVVELTAAAAAPLAQKQLISVTNATQNVDDPEAPHDVAKLIKSEFEVRGNEPLPPLGY